MSEGRKMAISVLVVIVMLGGVCTWLVVGVKTSNRLGVSVDQKNAKLTELQGKIAAIPALRQEQQKLAGDLDVLETILPNDTELNKIFDTISEYEKDAKVEIRSFSPIREKTGRGETQETSYKRVSYDLDLVGDFFSLVKFLNLLENHNRFVQVDSLNIKQKDEDSPVNEISLQLSTFVFDPKGNKTQRQAARRSAGPGAAGRQRQAPETPFDLKQELARRYVFHESPSLRDPFTNPLTRRISVAKFDQPNKGPARQMTAGQEKELADTIQTQLTEVGRLISDNKLEEAEKLLAETQKAMGSDFRDPETAKRQLGFSRRAQRLGILVSSAKGEKLYQIVQEKYGEMVKAFEGANYDEVYRLRGLVTETVKQGGAGVIHERLGDVVKSCDALCQRADARREFASIGIDIQGTFWSGSQDRRRAAVIVNNQVLVEGERLKAEGVAGKKGAKSVLPADAEIIVKKIDRDRVTFLYKNELIDKLQFSNE